VTLQLGKDPGSSDKYFKAYLAVFTAKKISSTTYSYQLSLVRDLHFNLKKACVNKCVKTAEGLQNWHLC